MANEVTKLIMETILGLITTAFAFVAGLAWNGAIQKLIEQFIGTGDALPSGLAWNGAIQKLIEQFIGTGDALPSLFIYAIVVTIIAVIVTVLLARVAGKMGIDLGDD